MNQMKQALIKGVTLGDGTLDTTLDHSISGVVHSIEVFFDSAAATTDTTISITDTGAAVDNVLLTLTDTNTDDEFFVRELEHGNTGTPLATTDKPVAVGKPKLEVSGDTGGGNEIKVIINYHSP